MRIKRTEQQRSRVSRLSLPAWVVLSSTLAAAAAHGQDVLGTARKLLDARSALSSTGDAANAIRSITEVSSGPLPSAVPPPSVPEGTVVLYRTSWCGYCKAAAAHMTARGVPYVERDIQKDPGARREYDQYRLAGVPVIVMGPRALRGFSASSFDSAYAQVYPGRPLPSPRTEVGVQGAPNMVAGAGGLPADEFRPTPSPSDPTERGTAQSPGAAPFESGDTLVGKIAGVPVYAQAGKTGAAPQRRLNAVEAVVYAGEQQAGFSRIVAAGGEGWVQTLMLKKP
jgi:glutaredoxin